MASEKKRRKRAKLERDRRPPAPGPLRHPDGDRRRRGLGTTYREVIAGKHARHQFELDALLPPEAPADDGEVDPG